MVSAKSVLFSMVAIASVASAGPNWSLVLYYSDNSPSSLISGCCDATCRGLPSNKAISSVHFTPGGTVSVVQFYTGAACTGNVRTVVIEGANNFQPPTSFVSYLAY